MIPGTASNNICDNVVRHAKLSGNGGVPAPRSPFKRGNYFSRRAFRDCAHSIFRPCSVHLAEDRGAVLHVFAMRNVLQVFNRVIGLNPVSVINFLSIRNRSKKRRRNKAVNYYLSSATVESNAGLKVPISFMGACNNSASRAKVPDLIRPLSALNLSSQAVIRPKSAEGRNAISGVFRNRSPVFHAGKCRANPYLSSSCDTRSA